MRRDRPWRSHRSRWFLLVAIATGAGVVGCATDGAEKSSRSQDLRSSSGSSAAAGRFGDWKVVIKRMAQAGGGSCVATSQDREARAVAIVFPAACLFSENAATPGDAFRPALGAIAAELVRVTDREFWIAARGSRGPAGTRDERMNRSRAEAVVAGLIASGVAPDRLAAVFGDVGPGGTEPGGAGPGGSGPGPVIEIVAAPRPF